MSIKTTVEDICIKYDTRNPFEVSSMRNIIVLFESLGNIRGFYNRCYRQQFIHVNHDLDEHQQLFTCAHELGHAIMHPNVNTPFLRSSTLFSVERLEVEANRFAVDFLYSDDYIKEYDNCSISDISKFLNLTDSLVEYRFSTIRRN